MAGAEEALVARSTYVVEPGDSLWSIAEELAPGSDPRPLVDAIAQANDVLDEELAAGEILVIPG
jgi:LysM repeat protein